MEPRWIFPRTDDAGGTAISWKEICGLPCIVHLLMRKNFTNAAEVDAYLTPRLKSLSDPFLIPQMGAAVARILTALDRKERIVLFGDYDVDGVTSLALLGEMLRAYGGSPELFLPLRMEEGYGLSAESVERCCQLHNPQLLIALDCGTSSTAEIAGLSRRGVDVIVVDHHEPKSGLPDCVAVVNPKAGDDRACTYLCSVGLVFKLCHALLKTRPCPNFDLKARLDLVALGTVADIVPLQFENRIFVRAGAREIARSSRPGLRKLMDVAALGGPILPEDIGFRLGPRLNAAGRLDTAEKALRLLLTTNEAEAGELADLLDSQNRERQNVERQILAEAEKEIGRSFDPSRDAAIVVGARDWHPGVLGIVAARIARQYHRPAIVIGFEDTGMGKGSGRSIDGFSLVAALGECSEHLEKFGGHEMAAGVSLEETKFAEFVAAFSRVARQRLLPDQLRPSLQLDHELSFPEVNLDLLRWHERLQPFGRANEQPVFFAREVEPAVQPRVLKEKHLALRLRQRGYFQRAIFFDGARNPLPPAPWDIAFRIKPDEYGGVTRVQLQVQAIRTSAPI